MYPRQDTLVANLGKNLWIESETKKKETKEPQFISQSKKEIEEHRYISTKFNLKLQSETLPPKAYKALFSFLSFREILQFSCVSVGSYIDAWRYSMPSSRYKTRIALASVDTSYQNENLIKVLLGILQNNNYESVMFKQGEFVFLYPSEYNTEKDGTISFSKLNPVFNDLTFPHFNDAKPLLAKNLTPEMINNLPDTEAIHRVKGYLSEYRDIILHLSNRNNNLTTTIFNLNKKMTDIITAQSNQNSYSCECSSENCCTWSRPCGRVMIPLGITAAITTSIFACVACWGGIAGCCTVCNGNSSHSAHGVISNVCCSDNGIISSVANGDPHGRLDDCFPCCITTEHSDGCGCMHCCTSNVTCNGYTNVSDPNNLVFGVDEVHAYGFSSTCCDTLKWTGIGSAATTAFSGCLSMAYNAGRKIYNYCFLSSDTTQVIQLEKKECENELNKNVQTMDLLKQETMEFKSNSKLQDFLSKKPSLKTIYQELTRAHVNALHQETLNQRNSNNNSNTITSGRDEKKHDNNNNNNKTLEYRNNQTLSDKVQTVFFGEKKTILLKEIELSQAPLTISPQTSL